MLKNAIYAAQDCPIYTSPRPRQLCARLQTDLLFRWFVDLPMDEAPFDASTYSKNQSRLLQHEVADLFFAEVVNLARRHGWVSDDHFSVDATLIESWASLKSFKPKGDRSGPGNGNTWTDFKGESRRNDTHESTSDPEAKLVRKGPGKEARLCFAGHATMENRHGLCVLFEVHPAVGAPESSVAVDQMIELKNRGLNPKTVGADKGYHDQRFVEGLREQRIEPHPALRKDRGAMEMICTPAQTLSQKCRKKIEEIFGWSKMTGCFRKSRYHGVGTHPRPRPVRGGRAQPSPHGPPDDACPTKISRGVTPRAAKTMRAAPEAAQNRPRSLFLYQNPSRSAPYSGKTPLFSSLLVCNVELPQ